MSFKALNANRFKRFELVRTLHPTNQPSVDRYPPYQKLYTLIQIVSSAVPFRLTSHSDTDLMVGSIQTAVQLLSA